MASTTGSSGNIKKNGGASGKNAGKDLKTSSQASQTDQTAASAEDDACVAEDESQDEETSEATVDLTSQGFLEIMSSEAGILLAVYLSIIMTRDLTPTQENVLGNFITLLGQNILYKAARDELNQS